MAFVNDNAGKTGEMTATGSKFTKTGGFTNDRVAAEEASNSRVKKIAEGLKQNYYEGVGGYTDNTAGSTATLGANSYLGWLAKPLDAAMNVAVEKTKQALGTSDMPDATAGEIWRGSTNAFDDEYKRAKEQAGGYGTAAEIAGSVVSPLNKIGGGYNSLKELGGVILAGGLQGAAKESNTLENAATGAATGAAVNAAVPAAVGSIKPIGGRLLKVGEDLFREGTPALTLASVAAPMWSGFTHGVTDPMTLGSLTAVPATWATGKAGELGFRGARWLAESVPSNNYTLNALTRRAGLAAAGQVP